MQTQKLSLVLCANFCYASILGTSNSSIITVNIPQMFYLCDEKRLKHHQISDVFGVQNVVN